MIRRPAHDGRPPPFTDYQFEALGVPRNRDIPANADPEYFDFGFCGPDRKDRYAQQPGNYSPVQDSHAAQCRHPPRLLPQRGVPLTG